MASAHDVARFVLLERGPLSATELHSLLYFAQGWSLVWDAQALFAEPIEAWPRGPVVREVWEAHGGSAIVRSVEGTGTSLGAHQQQTLRAVLAFYGAFSPADVGELPRLEAPWRAAIATLRHRSACPAITPDAIRTHFAGFKRVTEGKVLPIALRRGYELMLGMSPDELEGLYGDDIADVDVAREVSLLEA